MAALLFLAAVAAVAPIVRRCPFDLDRMDLRAYAMCSVMPKVADCRANAAACATTDAAACATTDVAACATTDAAACATTDVAACAQASPATTDAAACATNDASCAQAAAPNADAAACPMEMAAHATHSGCTACPFAPRPARSSGRHAYCLDEPGMAGATRVHPPVPPTPLAIAAAILTVEAPSTSRPLEPVADARPPTPPELSRPPIRGPPLLVG